MLRPFNRSIHLWLLGFAIAGFTYFGVQAGLFNLYLLRLGFGPQFIGLLVGSGQVLCALAALPPALVWAVGSDHHAPRAAGGPPAA
jgi:hypothetical protein